MIALGTPPAFPNLLLIVMNVSFAARLSNAALAVLVILLGAAAIPTDSIAQLVVGGKKVARVHAEGPLIRPNLDHTCGLHRVEYGKQFSMPPHPHADKSMKQTATIIVDYGPGFSQFPEAQQAFQRAVDTWAQHIESPVPIRIDASFADLGENVLGSAGPIFVRVTLDNGEQEWVSIPLLEAIEGQAVEDQFEINWTSSDAEIRARFNSDRSDWNFSDAAPSINEIDFESVVLHEIGHGLQYLSTFEVGGDCDPGSGCYGLEGNGVPSVFDRFVVEYQSVDDTQTPVTDFPNNSAQMADVIRVGNIEFGERQIRFDGPQAVSGAAIGTGPQPPILYFPGSWQQGSSGSHLDEQTYAPGTENALMTPSIGAGESARRPGAVVCGTLSDMGWPLGPACSVSADAPFNLNVAAADSMNGEVVLEWFVGPQADVESYTVRRQRFDKPFQTVATLPGDTDPRFIDSGLSLGEYTYALDYELANGDTGTANTEPTVTLAASQVALNVSAEGERSRIDIDWTVPASTSGFTYVVERRSGDDDEAEYQPLGRTTRTSLTDNAVTPGLYDYRITAVSSEADSVSSLPQTLFLEVDGNVFVSGPNPNPTTRFTQNTRIDITVDRSQNVSVSMYNMLGQRVYQENLRLDDNVATAIQIPVRQLSSGVYFIRIQGRLFETTQKMAVTR